MRMTMARTLALIVLLATKSAPSFVVTGVCETDFDCQDSSHAGCCARWNPGASTNVCKELGTAGDLCHMAANQLPFRFPGRRRFWRCPCGGGLTCVPASEGAVLGACGERPTR